MSDATVHAQTMPAEHTHVVCANCQSVVRVPTIKLAQAPQCPQCHAVLFTGHPFALTTAAFDKQVRRNDLALIIDVWAPWCGPCQMMAPHFEEAVRRLEPRARFAKLNSDDEPQLAARLNIRSIPTLLVFRNGSEVARQSGAMDFNRLQHWLQSVGVTVS